VTVLVPGSAWALMSVRATAETLAQELVLELGWNSAAKLAMMKAVELEKYLELEWGSVLVLV